MELHARAEDKTPYVLVALQECERMNLLTREMRRSLRELDLGLKVKSCEVSWIAVLTSWSRIGPIARGPHILRVKAEVSDTTICILLIHTCTCAHTCLCIHTLIHTHTFTHPNSPPHTHTGWADHYSRHGGTWILPLPRQGPCLMDKSSLPIPGWPLCMVCRPTTAHTRAWELGFWLQHACLYLACRLLQPSVLLDCHHAVHGSQKWVALGQDVSAMWRLKEKSWRFQQPTERRCLCPWSLHGGSSLGYTNRPHPRVQIKGSNSFYARHLYQSHPTGQAGDKKHVRVSSVQDPHSWSHLCMDLQFEDQGEASQVDHCRSSITATGIEDCLLKCVFIYIHELLSLLLDS